MTTPLTPDFSANTTACVAWVSSQVPNADEPVKSMSRISGRTRQLRRRAVPRGVDRERHHVGREAGLGEDLARDRDRDRERQHRARDGLTRTGLPVARLANSPG